MFELHDRHSKGFSLAGCLGRLARGCDRLSSIASPYSTSLTNVNPSANTNFPMPKGPPLCMIKSIIIENVSGFLDAAKCRSFAGVTMKI